VPLPVGVEVIVWVAEPVVSCGVALPPRGMGPGPREVMAGDGARWWCSGAMPAAAERCEEEEKAGGLLEAMISVMERGGGRVPRSEWCGHAIV
jgi:hypothetical protein